MTTLVAQAQVQGTISSRPVWLPFGAAFVVVEAVMNASDIATGGNVLGLCVQWTQDCVQVAHAASCVWQSGLVQQSGGGFGAAVPGLKMPIPKGITGFAGQLISPRSLDVGLAIDIQDATGNSLPLNVPSGSGVPVSVPVYPVLK